MKEVPEFHSLKERIAFYFEDIQTVPGRTTDLGIIALIILSSILYIAESYYTTGDIAIVLFVLDAAIMVVFTIEYLLRLWVAQNKVKHLSSVYSLIDLVAIIPFFIAHQGLGFVRLLRVFRILRLVRFIKKRIWKFTSEDLYLGVNILYTVISILFISSGLIYFIESKVNPENIQTFFDAFYYSVVTLTTVGFGDITPVSTAGKTVTIAMIVAGVVIIPLQISSFIRRMVQKASKVQVPCNTCGLQFHDPEAKFCRKCGTKLKK